MRITKLLSLDSEPAKPILDRAKPIALAFLERIKLPETFVVGDQTIENALGEVRPLEVGDVLVDENGGFYKIEAPTETIFKVTGDLDPDAGSRLCPDGSRCACCTDRRRLCSCRH